MKSSADRRAALLLALALAASAWVPGCVSPGKKIRAEKRSGSHLALARKLMEQQRLQEAITQADMAIKESKKNADAWLVRGQVGFMRREYPQAIQDLTVALQRRPAFGEALTWRAWAYIESGDAVSAERDYKEALKDPIYTTPEKIHLNLGLLYFKEGRDAEGLESLKRSVAMNPAYARGHYELGKALEKSGDLSGSLISYQAAIGGMKDSADLNLRLALALERSGDGGRAREHFRRVIQIDPDGPEASTARDHLRRLESPS